MEKQEDSVLSRAEYLRQKRKHQHETAGQKTKNVGNVGDGEK